MFGSDASIRDLELLQQRLGRFPQVQGASLFLHDRDHAGDPDFENTTTYRLGVEHGFFDSSFARFGFSYKPAYFDQSTSRAAFSVGLGMDLFGARADISGEVGVREYSLGGTERLRETTSVAMASLYYAF